MNSIFKIKSEKDFLEECLRTFRFQYENVEVYKNFVDLLKVNPDNVSTIKQIPFLPIEVFKNHLILNRNFIPKSYFQSSGTTQTTIFSKHFIADESLYEESIYQAFKEFIGIPEDFIFLGLLPNYLEKQNSSLVYMVDFLMKKSGKPENGYFLYNHQELFNLLEKLFHKKVILFGVSFALLDFLDFYQKQTRKPLLNKESIIIETGGMKGRKQEMTKEELLDLLQKGFQTSKIYSEYSMTECFSQAYSKGENIYECPNWMRIVIRNLEDPFSYVESGKTGSINIIDLANQHTCSFIATQDLGKMILNSDLSIKRLSNSFQILGRIDHSDIRGCSLLIS